nr:hypothetical protein [Streptomyces alanosinicus]
MVEVAGQLADAGVGGLAFGAAQAGPLGLHGGLVGGAGCLAVQDRGEVAGDLASVNRGRQAPGSRQPSVGWFGVDDTFAPNRLTQGGKQVRTCSFFSPVSPVDAARVP